MNFVQALISHDADDQVLTRLEELQQITAETDQIILQNKRRIP